MYSSKECRWRVCVLLTVIHILILILNISLLQCVYTNILKIFNFYMMLTYYYINCLKIFRQYNFVFHFQIHESMESLKKRVDPKVLPKELGGSMPMAEMIGK
jgi:hypothetical protein